MPENIFPFKVLVAIWRPRWLDLLLASSNVVCPGTIPQKQGAEQSTGSCNSLLIASVASLGSKVLTGVLVGIGVTVAGVRGVRDGRIVRIGGVSPWKGNVVGRITLHPSSANTSISNKHKRNKRFI